MSATFQLNGGQPQPEVQAQQLLNDLLVAPARVNDLLASSHSDVDDVDDVVDDVNDVLEEVLDGMHSYDFLGLLNTNILKFMLICSNVSLLSR